MQSWLVTNAHVIFWAVGCGFAFGAAVFVLRARHALEARTVVALMWAWLGLMLGGVWQARLESMPVTEALLFPPHELLSSGGRLPLGLATGAVLAVGWCAISQARWRATGDALAVAAPTLIIIGRFGCLAAGCCAGMVCGRRSLSVLCLHHGRDSEVFARQLEQGLVDVTAVAALPTHPLPIYFMIAAIALLAILAWQLRRDLAAGTLLVTFGLLWPLSKLALEQLREIPRPGGLMTAVPLAMIAASGLVLVLMRWGSGPSAQRTGPATLT